MKPIVTFGEIMCRLAAPGHLRLRQTRELEVTYAGAEASVVASICNFGGVARYVGLRPMALLALTLSFATVMQAAERPNVVLLMGDDLNDLPLRPDGKPLVPTPNIDRLAARGIIFTQAHSNDPLCAPSRSSMLFGLYPQTTGLYWFDDWRKNPIHTNSVSLPRHMRDRGYDVFATGKIFHSNEDDPVYKERGIQGNLGPWPWDGKSKQSMLPHPQQSYLVFDDPDMPYQWEQCFGSLNDVPDWPADKARGISGYKGWRLFNKPWNINTHDGSRDRLPDEISAKWASDIIARHHQKPFALFVGFVRTHTPLYAPQEYLNRFPLDSIQLPKVLEGDVNDCAKALTNPVLYGFRRFNMLKKHEDRQLYRKWIQAYMACTSFVDDQVGTVLNAIDRSPEKDNTIIVLTSDHGFHMGEKGFLYKQSLWDPSTHIPLIVAGVKGMAGGKRCDQPVSLIDIYPTLSELCGLPMNPNANRSHYPLDGHSMKPLLLDPVTGKWGGPDVVVSVVPGEDHMLIGKTKHFLAPHFSVRGKQWRYTLCSTGEEELYDHNADPLEWKNLAGNPDYASIKAGLKAQLLKLAPHAGKNEPSEAVPATGSKTDNEILKDLYFKKNPEADTDKDGALSWAELSAHRGE